jgi:hypothetical protein
VFCARVLTILAPAKRSEDEASAELKRSIGDRSRYVEFCTAAGSPLVQNLKSHEVEEVLHFAISR